MLGVNAKPVRVLILTVITGYRGDTDLLHERLRFALGAHQAQRFRGRPDENNATVTTKLGEIGVLREKAVSWVDSLAAATLRSV